ncbi:MAG: Tab2/Atab2 family RNA-binding protein [Oscillatoria sp. PMC 1068.18]|nr:Tab2/Atab2 family RNA-binding protein [Oscillatoria sp. PMC 1076.18]MEC4991465.1 Tab2/Atab2 family RNA-binding protein [Oscillatoria sp. PMC 1068.18]
MATIWELDFYSRPILDENNKKLWEILICESPLDINSDVDNLFTFSEFTSSKNVNSLVLREALTKAIAAAPKPPQKVRFFRQTMKNMIVKACEEIGLDAIPSRRTYALHRLIEKRLQDFYPQQSGYDSSTTTSTSIQYPTSNPIRLPDAVRGDKGDKWAFVSLEAEAFQEMNDWEIAFGESFPFSLMSVQPETKIPGLILFSRRAMPLAGWMSGLEIANLNFDDGTSPILRLETSLNESWILANLTTAGTLTEAKNFSAMKEKANKVHFFAVQSNPEAESFAGFWLLKG